MSELKIVFLGTGSARPTPRRNVAGVFLQYGGDAVLFDCGEGSQMQVLRAGLRTSRLVAICLSHFHGDHVNGLPGFIGTMGLNGHVDPVALVGPRGIGRWLETLDALQILRPGFPLAVSEVAEGPVFEGEDFTISACKLKHRIPTHGFIFRERDLPGRFDPERARALGVTPGPAFGRLQSGQTLTLDDGSTVAPEDVMGPTRRGRAIAYISDTRPSQNVVEAVAGVDLLVHEATYLHELKGQARERGHSTVHEAAEVAAKAGVGRLVLTHISPKHGRRSEILDEARAVFPNTELAEDLAEFAVPVPD
jgi:ribonuclease Z